MTVLLLTFRGLLAVLLALGMQLPCPCPSIAASAADAGAEHDPHSCCPGGDKDDEAAEKSPEAPDQGHVCSHCSDDHFTKAAGIDLPSGKATASEDGISPFAVAWFGPSGFLLAHPAAESAEHLLDRPPPEPLLWLPSGRTIRIHTCSYLC